MAIVVNAIQGVGTWVQGTSYLGYDNLFLQAGVVVAANDEDVGFPGSNATSWLTAGGGWQTTGVGDKILTATLLSAADIDSYGVYKHNLGTLGLTVKLQYSTDGAAWTDLPGSEKTPADDSAIYFVAAAVVSAKFFRLHVVGVLAGETLIIGNAFVSKSLRVWSPPETGWVPPNLALDNTYLNNRSEGGDFMGRTVIRKGSKTNFNISVASDDWIRSDWFPFMEAAEAHPFYHAWDTVAHASEVAFCYTDGKIETPKYVNSRYMSFGIKFFALID